MDLNVLILNILVWDILVLFQKIEVFYVFHYILLLKIPCKIYFYNFLFYISKLKSSLFAKTKQLYRTYIAMSVYTYATLHAYIIQAP